VCVCVKINNFLVFLRCYMLICYSMLIVLLTGNRKAGTEHISNWQWRKYQGLFTLHCLLPTTLLVHL